MTHIIVKALALGLVCATPALAADPALGLWQTEPDRKNLTSHIQITTCGDTLCGKIVRAFDGSGAPVTTQHVGKRLFWDLKPAGGGSYTDGTVYVPLLDFTAKATMDLKGNTLRVKGCKGLVCDGQVWTRVK